jgi:hypothetical protein
MPGRLDKLPSFEAFTDVVGLGEITALEQRFR